MEKSLTIILLMLSFGLGALVMRANLDDRLLPKDSTVYCPSESSCKYDYYNKQPHILRTGE